MTLGTWCLNCWLTLLLLPIAKSKTGGEQQQVKLLQVRSGSQLLSALNRTEVEWVGLLGDVLITPADTKLYNLPLVIANRNITIASADGALKTLNLGNALRLLYLESQSRLHLWKLRVKGAASVDAGREAGMPTEPQGWVPLWPTVDGDTSHEVFLQDVLLDRTKRGCTTELVDTFVAASTSLLGFELTRLSNLSIYWPGSYTAPMVLLDAATKQEVVRVMYTYSNVTMTCVEEVSSGQPGASRSFDMLEVRTGAELLAGLSQDVVLWINLLEDVYFSTADWEAYKLPLRIASNRSVVVASVDGMRKKLYFGEAPNLLWQEPGSYLHLKSLMLRDTPSASASAGGPAAVSPVYTRTYAPVWPIVMGAGGYEMVLEDVMIERVRGGCSPLLVSSIAQTLREVAGDRGNSSIMNEGLTIRVPGAITVQQEIVSVATKEEVGRAKITYSNFTVVCVEPGPGSAAPSPPEVSGGSSKSWVWALVGSLGGLAVVAAAGAIVLLQRRRARQTGLAGIKQQPEEPVPLPGGPLVIEVEAGQGTQPPSDIGNAGRNGSGTPGAEAGALGAATVWSTRVGPIAGLELGDLIGKGCYGRVYRGRWKGALVAVKVMEQYVGSDGVAALAREPLLSVSLSHPAVVTTYKLAVVCIKPDEPTGQVPLHDKGDSAREHINSSVLGAVRAAAELKGSAGGSSTSARNLINDGSSGAGGGGAMGTGKQVAASLYGAASEKSISASNKSFTAAAGAALEAWPSGDLQTGIYETVLVMEYCDRGSLTDAMRLRRFQNQATGELDLVSILLSLIEIAQGMDYLHDLNLVHADLKGRNVLLKTARVDRRGFTCKISDFGLTRMLDTYQTHVRTASYGTPSHAAPELLGEGKASKASDVYAFGVIVWEMVAGEEAHSGLPTFQLMATMLRTPDFRPPIPPSCPPPLAALIERCWQTKATARPSFGAIVQDLQSMLMEAQKVQDSPGGAEPHGGGGAGWWENSPGQLSPASQ